MIQQGNKQIGSKPWHIINTVAFDANDSLMMVIFDQTKMSNQFRTIITIVEIFFYNDILQTNMLTAV